jgi:hypothetical protein
VAGTGAGRILQAFPGANKLFDYELSQSFP